MRTLFIGGLALLVVAPLAVLLGDALELELDNTVFMGIALGAALALVPDRAPGARLGAFLAGIGAAWLTYLVRAGFTPDTAGGRAVSMLVLVALCVAIAVVSMNRLPLWAVLLGAAALAGGYETAYDAAPSEVTSTSVSAVTAVLLTVALGYLAGSVAGAPRRRPDSERFADQPPARPADEIDFHDQSHDDTRDSAGFGPMGGAR